MVGDSSYQTSLVALRCDWPSDAVAGFSALRFSPADRLPIVAGFRQQHH
jgi:hypothetical protein